MGLGTSKDGIREEEEDENYTSTRKRRDRTVKLITRMLEAVEYGGHERKGMSREEVVGNMIAIFVAGTDTVANTLVCWRVYVRACVLVRVLVSNVEWLLTLYAAHCALTHITGARARAATLQKAMGARTASDLLWPQSIEAYIDPALRASIPSRTMLTHSRTPPNHARPESDRAGLGPHVPCPQPQRANAGTGGGARRPTWHLPATITRHYHHHHRQQAQVPHPQQQQQDARSCSPLQDFAREAGLICRRLT